MKHFLKKLYHTLCIFALAAPAQLIPSLRSTGGESKEAIKTHSLATLPPRGTDFKDFADHAEMYASRLIARLTSGENTPKLTARQKGAILQQIREYMVAYKNEDDLAVDRDGNRVAAVLDRRESEYLETLIARITIPPSQKLLAERRKTIFPWLRHMFGPVMHTFPLPTTAFAISPDGSLAVTSFYNNNDNKAPLQIYRFSACTNNYEHQYTIANSMFFKTILISSDNSTIIARSYDQITHIYQFNAIANRWEQYAINHPRWITSIAGSADGSTFVTSTDNLAEVYRFNKIAKGWEHIHTIKHKNWISSVTVSTNGDTIVTDSEYTTQIHRYNTITMRWQAARIIKHSARIATAVSSDGSIMVNGSDDYTAEIYRYNKLTNIWKHEHTIRHDDYFIALAISADGSTVVTGSEHGTLQIYRFNNTTQHWEYQQTITQKDDWMHSVTVSLDGSTIIMTLSDMRRNYIIQTYRFNHTMNMWEHQPTTISSFYPSALSADHTTVATGFDPVKIYRIGLTEQELQDLTTLVTERADVALLLQKIRAQHTEFPHNRIVLTPEQYTTLLKLPLRAIELCTTRYHLTRTTPDVSAAQATPALFPRAHEKSSKDATSSGATDDQQQWGKITALLSQPTKAPLVRPRAEPTSAGRTDIQATKTERKSHTCRTVIKAFFNAVRQTCCACHTNRR